MPTLAELFVMIKGDDSQLEKSLDGAEKKTSGFASSAVNLLGGAVAGAAVAAAGAILAIGKGAFDVSVDTQTAAGSMAASLGLPIAEAEKFAEVAKRVYGNNFADSIGDAATAVEQLAKQMGMTSDDPALQTMAENAFRLRDAFGVEVSDSINAVKTLTENFGISSEEAFNLVSTGYQKGLDSSGDFLDTIGEYSNQFSNGGASASEFFSLLDSGLQGGMLGTDKAADAFKEFNIRIKDGSDLTAESLDALGGTIDSGILKGMQDGSVSAADAFKLVIEGLNKIEDPLLRMQTGVGLLGTQYEDLGDSAILAMDMTGDWAASSLTDITTLDAKYNTFGGAVEGMWRRLTVSVSPFTDKLLEMVNDAMPSVMAAFDAFDQNVGPAITSVGNIINTVVTAVQGYFSSFKSSIDTNASGPLQYWKDWIATNLPLVQTLIQNILGGIQTFWDAWGGTIMMFVNQTFGNIWAMIDMTMRNIGDMITLVLQVLNGDWEGAGKTLEGIVTRIWNTIYGIVSTSIETIKTLFTSVDWGEVGRNIMQGVIDGIVAMSSALWAAAQSVSQSLWDSMTGWWSIQSPSQKAKDGIGVPIAAGIIAGLLVGLTNGEPAIASGMQELINSMPGGSGMIQAEDGSWVPSSFYDKPATAPKTGLSELIDSFGGSSYSGKILAEDGSWVSRDFYDSLSTSMDAIANIPENFTKKIDDILVSIPENNTITVNQQFYGAADYTTVKNASQDGVLSAGRNMGMR